MSERDSAIHCARVYLAEAKRRRGQVFALTLIRWAGNQRRKAMRAVVQQDLFA
jgi:hypothetical protein